MQNSLTDIFIDICMKVHIDIDICMNVYIDINIDIFNISISISTFSIYRYQYQYFQLISISISLSLIFPYRYFYRYQYFDKNLIDILLQVNSCSNFAFVHWSCDWKHIFVPPGCWNICVILPFLIRNLFGATSLACLDKFEYSPNCAAQIENFYDTYKFNQEDLFCRNIFSWQNNVARLSSSRQKKFIKISHFLFFTFPEKPKLKCLFSHLVHITHCNLCVSLYFSVFSIRDHRYYCILKWIMFSQSLLKVIKS